MQASERLQNCTDLRPYVDNTAAHEEVSLLLCYIPLTDVIYRLGTVARELNNTQFQLAELRDRQRDADERVATMQRNLGVCIETLTAQNPSSADPVVLEGIGFDVL